MPYAAPPIDETSAETEWEEIERAASETAPVDDWKAALEEAERSGNDESEKADHDDFEADGGVFEDPEDAREPVGSDQEQDEIPPDISPPTIDIDPSGFEPQSRSKSPRTPKTPRAGRANVLGRKLLSGLVVGLAFAMVLATVGGALFARDTVVRLVPDLAGLYALAGLDVNLRGLVFEGARTVREVDGAAPVLVVDGTIRNVTTEVRTVPLIRFGLTSATGREVYAWTMEPVKSSLDPGETMFFRTRLPSPPESAADVQVRFTSRRGP